MDNERYGCGTKLPQNVTGLIGVMNGNSSDLRTGLPQTTPERLEKVIAGNPPIREFVGNRWIRFGRLFTTESYPGLSEYTPRLAVFFVICRWPRR